MAVELEAGPQAVEAVKEVVQAGGVVALPWGRARRATYVLIARADDADAVARMNRIKGRPTSQILAANGISNASGVMDRLINLDLLRTQGSMHPELLADPGALLCRLFRTGPVGVVAPAVEGLPPSIVGHIAGRPLRVMVAGESPPEEPANFYHCVIQRLTAELAIVTAGSSCNRTGRPTYSASDYQAAHEDIGRDVDAFVRPQLPIPRARAWDSRVSCTVFDLTTWPPLLVRHGSIHPLVFRPLLGRCHSSRSTERVPNAQSLLAGLIERATSRHLGERP